MLYFPQTGEMVGSGGTVNMVQGIVCHFCAAPKELTACSHAVLSPSPCLPPFSGIVVHLKFIAIGTWHRVYVL